MPTLYNDYAPYFRNGLLFLPEHTITLLIEAGLDAQIAEAARAGLNLGEQRAQITIISQSLEAALAQMEEDSREFRALSDSNTHFMLTGKPNPQTD
jgi:uncharacterized protein YdeI (YjbR/CyaY-like superfamily)